MSTAWGRTAWRRASQRRCAPGPRESASARSIPSEFRRSFLPLFAATCICGLWPACCRRISQERSRRTSAMPWKRSGPRSDRKTAMGPESVMDRARQRNQAGGVIKAMDRKTIAVFIDDSPSAEALLGYVEQHAADLLVLGAYSHARVRELLLGGVTRTLLARMPVPVLISR